MKRVQDEFFASCKNNLMAVGGVLYVDLLALPPPSKQVKTWVLRQVRGWSGLRAAAGAGGVGAAVCPCGGASGM